MYNEQLYNEHNYNLTVFYLLLSDSVTNSDSDIVYPQIVKVDAISLAETLSKVFNNDSFYDNIVPTEAIVQFLINKSMTGETMTLSEFLTFFYSTPLPETMTLIENFVNNFNKSLYDTTFLSDTTKVEITNKGLVDTVRLADWLTLTPIRQSTWSD